METQIITTANGSYLVVDLAQFNQKGNSFYVGKIKANDFLSVYTIRPARYEIEKNVQLAASFPDDSEYYTYLINEATEDLRNKDFQRDANPTRVNQITNFLNTEEYAFFPNTIIANCELVNDSENYDITEESSLDDYLYNSRLPRYLSFLKKDNDKYKLVIPYQPNSVLVIDGQHRLKGLEECLPYILNNYDLLIAFVIGFDRSVIAKQFYTINYEQKPVNKSLLYQLTGEFSKNVTELSFMHNVVKLLNETEESPFYSRIKMLGSTPKGITDEAKRQLSISQAFLVDSMIRFVSKKALNTTYAPIFLKYYQNSEEHIIIIRSIARFFNAVKLIKHDWNTPNESVLSKGMGVGALLKTYNLLFPVIFCRELNYSWDAITDLRIEDYVRILSGLENVDFSSSGEFGRAGSAGSLNRIKEAIIKSLRYLDEPSSYQIFEDRYKQNYLPRFNMDLNELIQVGQLRIPL